jgi:hypothetical protein
MKGGNARLDNREMSDELRDALPHLGCGFIGEGYGEYRIGSDAVLLNEISDAVGNDPGLARPGAGQDEDRAIDGFDGLALSRIKFREIQQV